MTEDSFFSLWSAPGTLRGRTDMEDEIGMAEKEKQDKQRRGEMREEIRTRL